MRGLYISGSWLREEERAVKFHLHAFPQFLAPGAALGRFGYDTRIVFADRANLICTLHRIECSSMQFSVRRTTA
jgi:hypothetical protein